MIEVYRIAISKAQLAMLSPDERGLLLMSGHALNVVSTNLKLVTYSSNRDSQNAVEQVMHASQTQIILHGLYGAVVEAYEWVRRPANQKLIGIVYLHRMSDESREAYGNLNEAFGQSGGLLHKVRNRFSYHYPDKAVLERAFEVTPEDEDWSWYMSQAISNSMWYACEMVVGHGTVQETGEVDRQDGLKTLVEHTMRVADFTTTFLMGLQQTMLAIHLPGVTEATPVLRVNGAPLASEFWLPFFLEPPLYKPQPTDDPT